MKRRSGKILGLAIGQKSILLAEVTGKGATRSVGRVGELVYPEGVSLEKPSELGHALRQFLKSSRFSARDAVIGLPARRLVTRRKEVPPAAPALAASALRLQAESEFSSEAEGFVMDFAGDTSTSESSTVLLVAASRGNITQCELLAKAAGLKLLAVTATGAALGRATSSNPSGNGVVVSLAAGGSELVVQHGSAPTQIRHLNMGNSPSGDSLGLLAGEIRRSVAALPRNGSPFTLSIWNSDDSANATRSLLEQRLSMPVTTPELRSLAQLPADADNKFAPAVALALAALDTRPLPVDFLDSRLAPPPPPSNRRNITIGVLVGILVLVVGWWAYSGLSAAQDTLSADRVRLNSIKDTAAQAQTELDRLNFARNWSPGKPRMLSCIRDLTDIFPDAGSIWASTLSLQPLPNGDFKGQLSGKAQNDQEVIALVDRMNGNHVPNAAKTNFASATLVDSRQDNSRGTNQLTFTISFVYRPNTGLAPAPASAARSEAGNSRTNQRGNFRDRRSNRPEPASRTEVNTSSELQAAPREENAPPASTQAAEPSGPSPEIQAGPASGAPAGPEAPAATAPDSQPATEKPSGPQ